MMSEHFKMPAYTEQLRYTGSVDQLCRVRRLTLAEGPGLGMRLIDVRTAAGMHAVFVESRALDLYELTFRGINIGFMTKNGLMAGTVSSVAGDFTRTWPGGQLATCGLRNAGPAGTDRGEYHPLHGRIGGIAAEQVSIDLDRPGNKLVIRGDMHETALFGCHLALCRTIEIPLDGTQIIWRDRVDNLTNAEEPLFILYHFNFGYPFLSPDLELHFPPGTAQPRDNEARRGLAEYDRISQPIDNEPEQVFFHLPLPENPPEAVMRLFNPRLGITAQLHYSTDELPILTEWKCMRATDYALGIEPSNSWLRGRAIEMGEGYSQILPAFGQRFFNLRLELS
jgi:hypothetical protein